MAWAAVIGGGAALLGGAMSANSAKKSAQAQNDAMKEANKPDPRVDNMLWAQPTRSLKAGVTPTWEMVDDGTGKPRRVQTNADSDFEMSQGGLMSQYRGFMDQPQSVAMKAFGDASGQYLQQNGVGDMNAMRTASMGLMGGLQAPQAMSAQAGAAPQAQAAPQILAQGGQMLWNKGESVNAPSQNGIDLSGSYNSLVNGPAGANPFLTGAIQKGLNQSSNAFGNMVNDAKSATQDVLGNIGQGAVITGGYGGSRHGIAQGKAIESMNTQLGRAASQFGQNNTDAAVAAQAGAYDADRNRQLAATQGLGAQQYGVASQDAQMRQQANLQNQSIGTNMSQFNAQQGQQAQQTNAAMAQNNNQFNTGLQAQNNQFNAGQQQQTNLANMQSQLGTNQLNTNRLQSGMAGLGGLLGTAQQNAANQDNWAINRATQVNGLLQPYLSKNPMPQAPQVFSNSAGAGIGGALMGMQLGQGLAGMFSNNSSGSSIGGNAMSGWGGPTNTPLSTNPSALQNLNFLGGGGY